MRGLRNVVLSGACCLLLTGVSWAKGVQLGEEVTAALKARDWQAVLSGLKAENEYASDPRMRLLARHACIALNQNNEAVVLFLSPKLSDSDFTTCICGSATVYWGPATVPGGSIFRTAIVMVALETGFSRLAHKPGVLYRRSVAPGHTAPHGCD